MVDTQSLRRAMWLACDQVDKAQDTLRAIVKIALHLSQIFSEHRTAHAAAAAAGPYVPMTDADIDALHVAGAGGDATMIAHWEALDAALQARYGRDKADTNPKKKVAKEAEIGQAHRILQQGLIDLITKTKFEQLKNQDYISADIDAFNQPSADQFNRIVNLSSVRLCIALMTQVSKQSGPKGKMISNIMLPPDVSKSLQDHIDSIDLGTKALKQMNFSSVDALLDHLSAVSMSNFITVASTADSIPASYREVYMQARDRLGVISSSDDMPLTTSKMEEVNQFVRDGLIHRNLPSAPPTSKAKPDPVAKPDAMETRLRKLEERLSRGKPRGALRGGRRGGGAGRGAASLSDNVPTTKEERRCFTCGKPGCAPSRCPMMNQEAKEQYERVRARNAERTLRRAQGAVEVSEDEDEEELNLSAACLQPDASPTTHISWQVHSVPRHWEIHPVANPIDLSTQPVAIKGEGELDTTLPFPAFRSKLHNNSIVHLFRQQCQIARPSPGAVVDTGAERSASNNSAEILQLSGKSHKVKGVVGEARNMRGILMGCETVDYHGQPVTLIVPDESVHDPSLCDSLLSAGRLMEANFKIQFRLPSDATADGFSPVDFPYYGGTIITPNPYCCTIVMEYKQHTWRIPPAPRVRRSPKSISTELTTINAFEMLAQLDSDEQHSDTSPATNASTRSEADQRRFELMCKRQKQAEILHKAHGHCNNRQTYINEEKSGRPVKHLKRYILAHHCKWCAANLGRKSYYCKKAAQSGGELEVRTIIDPEHPDTPITQTLAKEHGVTSPPPVDSNLRPFKNSLANASETQGKLAKSVQEQIELLDSYRASLHDLPSDNKPSPNCSPAGTDLRIDWADACSLGRSGERYFLLVVDKGTEYIANFNTKSRQNPVQLLREYINVTGKKPRFLRVDGAKEFVSDDMVEFCVNQNIILQTVVAYNHTMQARVEGAIGYVKQHSRVALLAANAPTRWWPQATTDFIHKKNYLWYSPDTPEADCTWSTAHQRMQPDFAGTYKTVAHPFGCRIVSTLPREHRLVVNGSFGDRFVEGIYLHADAHTPTVRMYDFQSRSELSVQDFTCYPDEFPLRDPSCLTRSSPSLISSFEKMHVEDAADDNFIAQELAQQAVTRSQTRAADKATSSPILSGSDNSLIESTQKNMPPQVPSSRIKSSPPRVHLPESQLLVDIPELELARSLVKSSYPIKLPPHYNPPDWPRPQGQMVVVAEKAQKQSSAKATVWVKFLAPSSHVGRQLQLYPKSLEPKNGPARGADFSLLTAIKHFHPTAKTWSDLGVTTSSVSSVTSNLLAALSVYHGGTPFMASAQDHLATDSSEISPVHLYTITDESKSTKAPPGYTRGMQDPKHRGQAMRSPLQAHWIDAERSEMEGLQRRKVWIRVLRSSLSPTDTVFATRFHYKIKRKHGEFDKCKVRLVVQGQHMHRKDANGIGDFDDAFSPVPHASGFRTILSLATQHNMFCDHVDISQAFCQGELLPGDGQNGKVYISAPPGFDEDPDYVYQLRKPLYGMPSAARAWHTTMSAYLKRSGCKTVGFERSMWTLNVDGHQILIAAHIDDFILACADRGTLDVFRKNLLKAFEGTYEGEVHAYLGCEIERDIQAGWTLLSQRHYAAEVLQTYNFWDCVPALTPMKPGTR